MLRHLNIKFSKQYTPFKQYRNSFKLFPISNKFISSDKDFERENKRIPRYYAESFRKKLDIKEIKEELMTTFEEDIDTKMTPSKIKEELDKYIIGQDNVKKTIANALRTRYRKRMLSSKNTEGIRSHNILISGKSGSGKTEILKQTSKICHSPFIKAEAVRYTEVGYHGDDIENIVKDLFKKTKSEFHKTFRHSFWKLKSVKKAWEHFVLSFLLGKNYEKHDLYSYYKDNLHQNRLDNMVLSIWYYDLDANEKFKISDIKNFFFKESLDKLSSYIDFDEIIKKNIEDRGIICIDEFDKLIREKSGENSAGKASDEGVQNDFLPLLDGTDIEVEENKRTLLYINTRNILFVALGAFTKTKPKDLIVEIQGRLPTSVQVNPLKTEDFKKILKQCKGNIMEQSINIIKTEGIHLNISEDALSELAALAEELNIKEEDTGARRLVSVFDCLLEEISYNAPDMFNEYNQPGKSIVIDIDKDYIKSRCDKLLKNKDLKKFLA